MNTPLLPLTPDRALAWRQARRVLAVRLDAAGDVLMTAPAIRALKASAPGRSLALLTSSAGAAAAALIPEVDEVLVYDAPWMKAAPLRMTPANDLAAVEMLRRRAFDAAVIFSVYSQDPLPAAVYCYLARIPLRLAHARDKAYQLLTDPVPDPEPASFVRHEVQRQLDLVAAVGCRTDDERLAIRIGRAASSRAKTLVGELGLDAAARPWAVLHPGATAPSRRYPPKMFAAAADALISKHGWDLVIAGSASDRAVSDEVIGAMKEYAPSIVGRLDLEELAGLLSRSPMLIANNSAPAHVAAAVGTPVVSLYALTNPQHTPWGVPSRVLFHEVPCQGCGSSVCPEGHHACLRMVTPDCVVAAALDLAGDRLGVTAEPSLGPLHASGELRSSESIPEPLSRAGGMPNAR